MRSGPSVGSPGRVEGAFYGPFMILNEESCAFLAIDFEDLDDVKQICPYSIA